MLIEVRGTGLVNKGAELMLRAVLQKVGDTFPEASFVVGPSVNFLAPGYHALPSGH